jgi:hypothetical protein
MYNYQAEFQMSHDCGGQMFKRISLITLAVVSVCSYSVAQNCALSGTPAWSPAQRNVISGCRLQVSSPDGYLELQVDTDGTIVVISQHERRKLLSTSHPVEAPAMVSWSPTSKSFFVNDGEGSGMSSVLRSFEVRGAEVVEVKSIEREAVATYRRRTRCSLNSADPNVWGLGWSSDGSQLYVLVQATNDSPCGRSSEFIGLVVDAGSKRIEEQLTAAATRHRFRSMLPDELRNSH